MTCTCTVCKQIIDVPPAQMGELLVHPNRDAMEFELLANMFAFHLQQSHPDILHTLHTQMVRNYAMNLAMKFATSSDERFEELRENQRALAYWTLLGNFMVGDQAAEARAKQATGARGVILG